MIVIEIEVEEAMISTERETAAIRGAPEAEVLTGTKRNLKV
jgi:hypothetical protein